jgi:hypothetical protein
MKRKTLAYLLSIICGYVGLLYKLASESFTILHFSELV